MTYSKHVKQPHNGVLQWLSQVDPSDGVPAELGPANQQPPPVQGCKQGAIEYLSRPGASFHDTPLKYRKENKIDFRGAGSIEERLAVQYIAPQSRTESLGAHINSALHDTNRKQAETMYERRPRRKTRRDRYDPKVTSQRRESQASKVDIGKRPSNTNKSKRKRGRMDIQSHFIAPNVSRGRLTLRSNFDIGLFARGRASSPVKRCELPDLAFSEMNFLTRPGRLSKPDNISDNEKGPGKRPFEEISQYFSQTNEIVAPVIIDKPDNPQSNVPLEKSLEESEVLERHDTPMEIVEHSKMNPVAGDKPTNASATYYSWSNSNPASPRVGAKTEAEDIRTVSDSPEKDEDLPLNDRTVDLLDDLEYDPLIVSRAYNMIFKNAYLDQAYERASSGVKPYTIEDLQDLASRSRMAAVEQQQVNSRSQGVPANTATAHRPIMPIMLEGFASPGHVSSTSALKVSNFNSGGIMKAKAGPLFNHIRHGSSTLPSSPSPFNDEPGRNGLSLPKRGGLGCGRIATPSYYTRFSTPCRIRSPKVRADNISQPRFLVESRAGNTRELQPTPNCNGVSTMQAYDVDGSSQRTGKNFFQPTEDVLQDPSLTWSSVLPGVLPSDKYGIQEFGRPEGLFIGESKRHKDDDEKDIQCELYQSFPRLTGPQDLSSSFVPRDQAFLQAQSMSGPAPDLHSFWRPNKLY